jgi:hypothetical protein
MSVTTDFSKEGAFDPAAIKIMAEAYRLGCVAIEGRPESDKARLAGLILEAVKDGERDVAKMCVTAVNAVTTA